ncbi:binding-protein-dependent transport systems inner membrane component [Cellulomonas flavigena DSM 20109]|uniref:Binding-protein-dependent transport systems inner membrane component n=1 Tax=Cellulomonas flavigena (strain ATCC 482 / DSM 20109 / BCRC 11376 / JCM 18109 / NBRC 3775 / NCIMB 8073 / NRS 134) TaxID=446466 RepID=D5UH03_CELFN|nr:ABC transporter permease [Cellulomonas flavigena]ADG73206.1 binding-protein-dependent transport systems inner membrane component [Cellulomonas flavigena DSM 20109]
MTGPGRGDVAPAARAGAGPRPAPARRARRRSGRSTLLGALGVLGFAATWEVVALTEVVDPRFLPRVTTVAARLVTELGTPRFWEALGDTVVTWAIGLGLAVVAAVVAGTVVGLVPFLRRATHTTVEFLRPIPSVAIIPLAVLLAGLSREAALVIVVYAPFWQVFVQVLYGVGDVDTVADDTARSFGLGRWQRLRHVVLPTALPYVITGFRLAASIALVLTITAELVIGNPGIGRQIDVYRSNADAPGLYALVLVTGGLGLLVNLATRLVERRVLHWHPSVRKEGVA